MWTNMIPTPLVFLPNCSFLSLDTVKHPIPQETNWSSILFSSIYHKNKAYYLSYDQRGRIHISPPLASSASPNFLSISLLWILSRQTPLSHLFPCWYLTSSYLQSSQMKKLYQILYSTLICCKLSPKNLWWVAGFLYLLLGVATSILHQQISVSWIYLCLQLWHFKLILFLNQSFLHYIYPSLIVDSLAPFTWINSVFLSTLIDLLCTWQTTLSDSFSPFL